MSGKTTAAEQLRTLVPDSTLMTMQAYSLQGFIDLHGMQLEEFLQMQNFKQNRILLGVYVEHCRNKDRNRFLTPILTYMKNLKSVVVEDVYYFNELEALIKLGAKLIWIEADAKKRAERNMGPLPDNDPLESEVANMDPELIRKWPNTYIVTNNQDLVALRVALRPLVYK